MTDHTRILGTLFMTWAGAFLVGALWAVFGQQPLGTPTPLFWAMALMVVLGYGAGGLELRRHSADSPRTRTLGLVLSAFALLFFPVGTLLGIYGLWVMLRRRHAPA